MIICLAVPFTFAKDTQANLVDLKFEPFQSKAFSIYHPAGWTTSEKSLGCDSVETHFMGPNSAEITVTYVDIESLSSTDNATPSKVMSTLGSFASSVLTLVRLRKEFDGPGTQVSTEHTSEGNITNFKYRPSGSFAGKPMHSILVDKTQRGAPIVIFKMTCPESHFDVLRPVFYKCVDSFSRGTKSTK